MSERIDSLLAQMTLDEKVSLIAGASVWYTVPVGRLGIPAIKMADSPLGARGEPSAAGGVGRGKRPALFCAMLSGMLLKDTGGRRR